MITLIDAMRDPALFGPWFKNPDTWKAWRSFACALTGHPMEDEEAAAIFRECTARETLPSEPYGEAVLACGRRAGKSFMMSLIAVYVAVFRDYRPYLAPGERATVFIIATDRKQARTIFRYIGALLREVPMIAKMVERETTESFDLSGRVTIEVGTASYKSTRGYTIAACIADEIAFWPSDDAAEPDFAILDAVRPGMATIPNSLLLCASSPYAKRGVLWDAYRRYYGKDDAPVLFWQASTQRMNPLVPDAVIRRAVERDEASAQAEFFGQFRSDVESFLSLELVEGAMRAEPIEIPRVQGVKYFAHADPAGGGKDEYTLAIGHCEGERVIIDMVRGRRGSPADITGEFAAMLKAYGLRTVTGDRYAGSWPGDEYGRHGIEYQIADQDRSGLYLDLLAGLSSNRVELTPCEVTARQLIGLERKSGRVRDIIDHAPNSHDDRAVAVAGVVSAALKTRRRGRSMVEFL